MRIQITYKLWTKIVHFLIRCLLLCFTFIIGEDRCNVKTLRLKKEDTKKEDTKNSILSNRSNDDLISQLMGRMLTFFFKCLSYIFPLILKLLKSTDSTASLFTMLAD